MKKYKFKNRMTKMAFDLGLPPEATGQFTVTATPCGLRAENFHSLLVLNTERVVLGIYGGEFEVGGEKLHTRTLEKGHAVINGIIKNMEFRRTE